MPRFIYTGTHTSRETIEGKEVVFIPGKPVELSSSNKRVGFLIAQGVLELAKPESENKKTEAAPAQNSKSTKSEKSESKTASSKKPKNK